VPAITVSVGIAMFGPNLVADLESSRRRPTQALYEAKRAGRDSLRVAGERHVRADS